MPGKKGSSHNSSSSPGMQGIWGNAINSKKEIERILAEGEHTSRDLSRDSAVWENLPTAPNTLSPYIFSSLSNNLFQFLIRRANLRFSQSLLDRGAIEFIAMYGGSAQFAAEAMGTISLPKGAHVGGLELGANLNLTPDDVGAILQSTLSRAGNASNRIAEQDVFRHTANGVALSDIADIHPSQTRELQEDLDDLFADNKSHESDEDQAKLVIAATLLACLPYVAMPLRNDAGITESLQPLSENIQRYFDMYLRLFGLVDSEGPIATQPQHPLSQLFYWP